MSISPVLPPEIWRHILSYIDGSLLLRICGVNSLFYDVAVDHRYRRLWLGYISNTTILRAQRLRDPWFAKRVKSLYVATGAVCSRANASRITPSNPKKRAGYGILSSFLSSVVSNWAGNAPAEVEDATQLDIASMSAESLIQMLDEILNQLKNVAELEIILDYTGNLDFELDFLRKLCYLFVSRRSIQALSLQLYDCKLHLVLPLMQFNGLKNVSLTLFQPPKPVPLSADAFSQLDSFLNYIAPSVEALRFAAPNYGTVEQMSSSLHRITMPSVRELETPLMFDDLGTIQSMDSRYPSLAVLKLCPWIPTEVPTISFGCLQLSSLRSLTLSFSNAVSVSNFFMDGPSRFHQLEKLNIIGTYMFSNEVDMMCKFFANSSITRLGLDLYYLDAHAFDHLSLCFPVLHTLDLRAVYVTLTAEPGEVALSERQYPDWKVYVINLKLRPGMYTELTPVLRCIPSLKVLNVERISF